MSDARHPTQPPAGPTAAGSDPAAARFRSLFERAFTAMLLTAPDGRVLAANPAACELFGMTEAEIRGAGRERLMVQDEALAAALAERQRAGRALALLRYRRGDGSVSTAEVAGHTHVDGSGRTLAVLALRDVTEQEVVRRALEERRHHLSAVLETSLDGCWVVDPDGRLLLVNDAYCAMSGYAREELLRLKVSDVEAIDDEVAVRERIGRVAARGSDRFESRHRRKDGAVYDVEVSVRPVGGDAVAFIRDITDRKVGEEALRRSRTELRALAAQLQAAREQEMGRIARDLHDDLGQALTGLQLDLRWLEQRLEELPADDRTGPILDRLVAASELAQATLNTVQRIALDLRPASLDQLGLAGAIRQEARRFTQRTGLPVEHRLEVEVGPAAPVATALYRICQEALTNVARHARASRVSVRLRQEDGALLLEVEDDGQGLPEVAGRRWGALGVLGMEERAASLGGWLRLGRGTLGGTLVVARIPVSSEGGAK